MLGTLFNFGADTSQFSKAVATMPRDVQRAQAAINGHVRGMNAAFAGMTSRLGVLASGFLSVYTAARALRGALDISSRMQDMANATGESAGNLAVLERAFANTGVGADRLGQMISKMQAFVGDLGRGSASAVRAASALGVTFSDLHNKSPMELFQILSGGLERISGDADKADASMEVFGTRGGGKVAALLKNLNGEIGNARTELGSLPEILDRAGESMDKLADKLENSIGNKLNEFAVGIIAGAQGANDFVDALSKIDAAGAGLDFGKLLNFAFTDPIKALEALGNTLLSVLATIGNEVVAQVSAALKGMANLIVSREFWMGIGNTVQGALLTAASAFEHAIKYAIASAIEAVANIPIAGRAFTGLAKAARESATQAGEEYRKATEQAMSGMGQAGSAFMNAGRGTYNRQDLFGEAYAASRAVKNYTDSVGSAAGNRNNRTPSRINATAENTNRHPVEHGSLPKDSRAKNAAGQNSNNTSLGERGGMFNNAIEAILNPQLDFSEFTRKSLIAKILPMAEGQNQTSANAATEGTLQKVATLLESLNTKLPQPVLV